MVAQRGFESRGDTHGVQQAVTGALFKALAERSDEFFVEFVDHRRDAG
jgi:hypothetical protein